MSRIQDGAEPPAPAARAAARPPGRSRRVARWIGGTLGVLLLALAMVVAWLHTAGGRAYVRRTVEARLATRLQGGITLGALDYALFGSVTVRGLRITDDAGTEVVVLDELTVRPAWRSLIGGAPVIEALSLNGLHLSVVELPDGTTNLSRLLKPTPPSPTPPTTKPVERRIQIRSIALRDIDATLQRADGGRVALSDLSLDASVDAVPSVRTVALDVPRIEAGVAVERPGGGSLAVTGFKTGLRVALDRGAGRVSLLRTTAHAKLVAPGAPPRETDLDLDGIDVGIDGETLDVNVGKILAGALALKGLDVRGRASNGALVGDQSANAVGLHLDAAQANALLQRDLLASDVDAQIEISGPPERIHVQGKVVTTGGTLHLEGNVDASDRTRPSYELTLLAEEVSTERLLREGASTAPPIRTERLRVNVTGKAASREAAEGDVRLELGKTTIGKLVIEQATLTGRYERGVLTIHQVDVRTLGQRIGLAGKLDVAQRHVSGKLSLAGDVGVALDRLRAAGIPAKARVPAGMLVVRDGALAVDVDGDLDGVIHADVTLASMALAGGSVSARASVDVARGEDSGAGRKFQAKRFDADIHIHELDLGAIAELRGASLPGVTGAVSGRIHAAGSPEDPAVDYELHGRARPAIPLGGFFKSSTLAVDVGGKATRHRADATVAIARDDGASRLALLDAKVEVPLAWVAGRPRLAADAPLRVDLDMPRRSSSDYLAFVPKALLVGRTLPSGEGEAHLHVAGTARRPQGSIDVDVTGAAAGAPPRRLRIAGKIAPAEASARAGADRAKFVADLSGWLDAREGETLTGRIEAALPTPPGARPTGEAAGALDWAVKLDVRPTAISSLPSPTGNIARSAAPSGCTSISAATARTRAARSGWSSAASARARPGLSTPPPTSRWRRRRPHWT